MFATVEKSPVARLWMYPERSLWRFAGQSLYWPWSPFSGQTLGSLLMIWETGESVMLTLDIFCWVLEMLPWIHGSFVTFRRWSSYHVGEGEVLFPSLANAAEHTLTSLATTWVGNVSKDVSEEIVGTTNFPNLRNTAVHWGDYHYPVWYGSINSPIIWKSLLANINQAIYH